jgi:hypothetical protein
MRRELLPARPRRWVKLYEDHRQLATEHKLRRGRVPVHNYLPQSVMQHKHELGYFTGSDNKVSCKKSDTTLKLISFTGLFYDALTITYKTASNNMMTDEL